jgi:polar amino acid transport system permease protein
MSEFSWDWAFALSIVPQLVEGLKVTVALTFFGSLLAFLLGLVWTIIRLANIPVLSAAASFFVEFVRGTPFLVQVYFLFYVSPGLGITFSAFVTGIIALALFNSAYIAEVYRAGIEGIAVGQWEASLTLGLPVRRVWTGIVLPQALRTITPMLGNYVIVMFKETAVLSTITVMELLAQAMDAGFLRFRFIEPLTMAALLYFVVSYASAKGIRMLEARTAVRG